MFSTSSKSLNTLNGILYITELSVQVCAIIVQLLNPLAQSGLCDESQLQEVRTIIMTHAKRGLDLIKRATRLYTARFHMPLINYCCVHLAEAVVVYKPEEAPEALHISMVALQEARIGSGLCGPLLELLRERALAHNIELPTTLTSTLGSPSNFDIDQILDACTRMTYTQPLKEILCHFDSSPTEEQPQARITRPFQRPIPAYERMQVDALLNNDES